MLYKIDATKHHHLKHTWTKFSFVKANRFPSGLKETSRICRLVLSLCTMLLEMSEMTLTSPSSSTAISRMPFGESDSVVKLKRLSIGRVEDLWFLRSYTRQRNESFEVFSLSGSTKFLSKVATTYLWPNPRSLWFCFLNTFKNCISKFEEIKYNFTYLLPDILLPTGLMTELPSGVKIKLPFR